MEVMAQAPLHQCTKCRKLVRGKCEACSKQPWSRSKASQAAQELYGHRWAKVSERYRQEHPLCAECDRQGRTTPSQCTDHIVPHRGDEDLFWEETNFQALCDRCHRAKTARGE